jgi:lysine 6-dehydrogenase
VANLVVLGGGRVGGAMAIDLAKSGHTVKVADASDAILSGLEARWPKGIPPMVAEKADLSNAQTVRRLAAAADVVIGAVPGFMGYNTVEAAIAGGKPIVDISFFDEDPFGLTEAAHASGVPVITDCGVAPGVSNLTLGHHAARADKVLDFTCYVGGLPAVRTQPWEYKAGFSPIDVIEEYTRPARLKEKGEIVIRPALSEPEFLEFEGIGTLEAFNTDGLRSILTTIDCASMKEKTLRYPGHIDKMRLLRDAGFLGKEPIEVAGQKVRPLDLAAKLLFPAWQLAPTEEEFTVMRIAIEVEEGGKVVQHTYDLLDRYDPETRTTSMARTTGYTATAAVAWLLGGNKLAPGVYPPELWAKADGVLSFVLKHLAERGVAYRERHEGV